MGRRKAVAREEKGRRRLPSVCRTQSSKIDELERFDGKDSRQQVSCGVDGGLSSRKCSIRVGGGNLARLQSSNNFIQDRPENSSSFRHPPHPLEGPNPGTCHGFASRAPMHQSMQAVLPQHLPPAQQMNHILPQQQSFSQASLPVQCRQQGQKGPFPTHSLNFSNGAASDGGGSLVVPSTDPIQVYQPTGNPLLVGPQRQICLPVGDATQENHYQTEDWNAFPSRTHIGHMNGIQPALNAHQQALPVSAGGLQSMQQQEPAYPPLPPLPFVMTPQGPMAPQPLFLFNMQGFSMLSGVMPQRRRSLNPQLPVQPPETSQFVAPQMMPLMNGSAIPARPLMPQDAQRRSEHDQVPVESPPPALTRRPSFVAAGDASSHLTGAAAASVNANAQTSNGGPVPLLRTQSILSHTSSFKKKKSDLGAAPRTDDTQSVPQPSILNRVSSFKKVSQPVSGAAPPTEVKMEERLQAREQERLRLHQEMNARAAAIKAEREKRLAELKQQRTLRTLTPDPLVSATPRVLTERTQKVCTGGNGGLQIPGGHSCRPSLPPQKLSNLESLPLKEILLRDSPPSQTAMRHQLPFMANGPRTTQENRLNSPIPNASCFVDAIHSQVTQTAAVSDRGPAATMATSGVGAGITTGVAGEEVSGISMEAAHKKIWHRSLSLVLYEIPLRCSKRVISNGMEQIDDSSYPVRIFGNALRITDAAGQRIQEYQIDELVMHRRGSMNAESMLFQKLTEVVIAGYSASVLSLDAKSLTESISAFESAAWLAKRRLLMNVVTTAKQMQSMYEREGVGTRYFQAAFSFALVKKMSSGRVGGGNSSSATNAQMAYEVLDLLHSEPTGVPLKMQRSLLFGQRIADVEYRTLHTEEEFVKALMTAQASANIVLGRLADAVARDPQNEEAASERASVFQVVTCVLTHRKSGAVSLQEQMEESAGDFYRRKMEGDVSFSDEEDEVHSSTTFRSRNKPSRNSDIILNCLTCIGAQQNHHLWSAALERDSSTVPVELMDSVLGGPTYTLMVASIDPSRDDAAAALNTQSALSEKFYRRPLNGSVSRLLQTTKYKTGASRERLQATASLSAVQQEDLKGSIRENNMILESLRKVIGSFEAHDLSVSGAA